MSIKNADIASEISKISSLYTDLESHIATAKEKTIQCHIGKYSKPDEFKIPVASFVLLSHAAIEEYLEQIILFAFQCHILIYQNWGITTRELLGLINDFSDKKIQQICQSEKTIRQSDPIFQIANHALSEVRKKLDENHGIRDKHVESFFRCLNVVQPNKYLRYASWNNLTDYRGGYAHKSSVFTTIKILGPEDADNTVDDCLNYCAYVCKQVINSVSAWTRFGMILWNNAMHELLSSLNAHLTSM